MPQKESARVVVRHNVHASVVSSFIKSVCRFHISPFEECFLHAIRCLVSIILPGTSISTLGSHMNANGFLSSKQIQGFPVNPPSLLC